jgi:hypothetical protein
VLPWIVTVSTGPVWYSPSKMIWDQTRGYYKFPVTEEDVIPKCNCVEKDRFGILHPASCEAEP